MPSFYAYRAHDLELCMAQSYVTFIQIIERYKYMSIICMCWEGIKLIKILPIFFFICIYYFQPVFYRLGMSRGIYNCVFFYLFTFTYVLSYLLSVWAVLGLRYLIFLELILKLLEDGFEEACDADGVYVVLQNQRQWDRFECRWAVGRQ